MPCVLSLVRDQFLVGLNNPARGTAMDLSAFLAIWSQKIGSQQIRVALNALSSERNMDAQRAKFMILILEKKYDLLLDFCAEVYDCGQRWVYFPCGQMAESVQEATYAFQFYMEECPRGEVACAKEALRLGTPLGVKESSLKEIRSFLGNQTQKSESKNAS